MLQNTDLARISLLQTLPFEANTRYCIDRREAGDLRRRTRAEHLEYMIEQRARIVFGGPPQNDEGTRVIGSLMVLSHEDRAGVGAFLQGEPYSRAGLFAEVRITRLRQMVPEFPRGLLLEELARERAGV
ncbi:YciI family protein [Mesorhizobium xinjiangense]|uniref:YciI family protein n=1 Tax=Mesorhizobium xinjiangense TaxID=2678685 RepID=UPI0018DBE6B9|nr:YciI family protein [Mesorhizobium xinjiangense]